MCIPVYMCVHVDIYEFMYMCYVQMYACEHVHLCVRVNMRMHVCVQICVFMCICKSMYLHVHVCT